MNVLYYLERFPSLSETFILNEISELTRRGHNVAVFALGDPGDDIRHEEYDALDIDIQYAETLRYANAIELVSWKAVHPAVLSHATHTMSPTTHGATLHRSKQCIEFIDQLDFDLDVVHTHFATPKTFSARYVSAYYDVPCTVTTHAHDLYDDPDQVQVAQMLGAFDHIVTISEYNRQYIRKHLTDDSPISVVHAGVRPTKFEPGAHGGPPRILTVCRFVEKKGVPYGLDAVAKIVDQFPELEYHLIGSGPMANEIRTQIIEHGLSNTVELLSNVDDDRLRTEYAEASCVLLPAIIAESGDRDGIPVVLMEAMATETPPISTTVSGIPELIDNRESGLLVTPRDVAALADALALLLADPELQQEFGRAGRGKIRRAFDIRTEVAKLEGIFSAVVASSS